MAVLNGDNYTKAFVDSPITRLAASDAHGRVRYWSDQITLAAELGAADTILLMKLPKGAKVVDARMVAPIDGGGGPAGQISLGWQSNGTDAADANGFFDGPTEGDFGAAALDAKLSAVSAGYQLKFAEETQIEVLVDEASTTSTGNTFKFELFYIVD
jgi:hypothetical protein